MIQLILSAFQNRTNFKFQINSVSFAALQAYFVILLRSMGIKLKDKEKLLMRIPKSQEDRKLEDQESNIQIEQQSPKSTDVIKPEEPSTSVTIKPTKSDPIIEIY